ncbi:hypothetical protein GCM10009560_29830 [Nonomuraea longicatena]|uniref:Uncharacterized protein n=1 Tax=Nonomuraea longicatena TaxID=83682 RepID=A0ABN1PEX3_9ACTN
MPSRNCLPTAVMVTLRLVRSKSRTPNRLSSFGDGLADPALGHAGSLCGTAEMQFFGESQKNFDLMPFHAPSLGTMS